MPLTAEEDGETIHDKLIAWAEANPLAAARMLSRTISSSPVCAVFDMIAWGQKIGMQGLPEIEHEEQPQ